MIRTEGLGKRFGDRWAIRDLTIEIAAGEVFGFLGPNGAGKTTTVRMLAGLIRPSTGSAWIDGISVESEPDAIRERIGLLTESPGHYEALTARRNLLFHANLHGLTPPFRDEQVDRYLERMGLWDQRDSRVSSFSKGMRQRLAIARTLLHEPPVLFLDEPTSGLDPEAARLVREFIIRFREQGRTVFLTTHNLDEAARLCDRVAFIRGVLLRVDSPTALQTALFGRRLIVRLANPSTSLVEAARSLPRVCDVSLVDKELAVDVADLDRDAPDLISALVTAGARIERVTESTYTLEDVYHEIMGDDGANGDRDGAGLATRQESEP
jgi:ABC-2 type transport system ATP-binding protein